jgi:3-deoxy-D-manno-octulosonate 8-phosphate phosphatase KdsC-like HAD superfamily phosphatase
VKLQKQMKQQFVLDRLLELGVTHSQQGQPIQELAYEDLKYELVLAEIKAVDIDNENNRWFR